MVSKHNSGSIDYCGFSACTMVDAVVSVFLEKLVAVIQRETQVILDFHDEFEKMQKNLMLMQGFLKDVDRMQRKIATLSAIANELRELVYDADDILVACSSSEHTESNPVLGGLLTRFSPKEMLSRYGIGKKLKTINEKIRGIEAKMRSFLTSALMIRNIEEEANNDRNWGAPIFDETQIVGLEGSADKIKKWMFQASEELTTMGFVGMGGLGKTTIAQKVFNDKEIGDHFEKRMWISVSRPVEEEKIMRSILRCLGDVSIDGDQGEMLKKIHAYLSGKSYLLVLDDVWVLKGGWWERLKGALPKGKGSCVVITTRNEEVAQKMGVLEDRIHRPELLTPEWSWSLFSNIAFVGRRNMCQDPRLCKIGKEIVEKCDGLPLAIKAVGGLMASKSSSTVEWRRIADSFNEELAENGELVVMASLQLSYDELPAYLKSCLLCFSIYPEDCIILSDQLIRWWIGEGFVHMTNGKILVETAERCFMGLVNRCLVEIVDKGHDGKVYTCKMHDLVRDLVIKVGGTEAFCQKGNSQPRRKPINDDISESNINESSSKLRALVSVTNCRNIGTITSSFIEKICGCKNLRVLDLSESISDTYFEDMLSKIGSLLHLRYLNLRNAHPMRKVPLSISNLHYLLVLDLSFCQNLETLPTCITDMTELMVLDVSCCGSLKYLPKGLGKLSHLQVLKGFKPSRPCFVDGCQIKELQSLTKLMALEIVVTRADEIADDEVDALSSLGRLRHMTVSCFNSHGLDLVQKLEQLSLPEQLNEFILKYYPGDVTPQWLNPYSLPELQYLSICAGNFTHFNRAFYGDVNVAWRVTGLMLELLPDLDEEWQRVHAAMPLLKELNVSWCPMLGAFPVENVEFEGGVWKNQ